MISAAVHRIYLCAALAAVVCLCFAAQPALGRQSQEPAHSRLWAASRKRAGRATGETRLAGTSAHAPSASPTYFLTRGISELNPSVFSLKDRGTNLGGITQGPEGNLWVTEEGPSPGEIGRVTPTGEVTEFAIPTSKGRPEGITSGPDGNLWFTERAADKIGRITPAGKITEFPLPSGSGSPTSIAAGPEGNLWFTEEEPGKIGQMTVGGEVTEFNLPVPGSAPRAITVGPDGNLWFGEKEAIGRITPAGQVAEFALPANAGEVAAITTGPDGSLWFTATAYNEKLEEEAAVEEEWGTGYGWEAKVGRITPAGEVTEFDLPIRERAEGITTGPEGDVWLATEQSDFRGPWQGTIDRISPLGRITRFTGSAGAPSWITLGAGGSIWYTTNGGMQSFSYGSYGPSSGALEGITPPPLETLVEIARRAPVRHQWAQVLLTCGGGKVGSSCDGELRLIVEVRQRRLHLLDIGRRRFTIPWESSRQVAVHLTHRALTLLAAHHGGLSAWALAPGTAQKAGYPIVLSR